MTIGGGQGDETAGRCRTERAVWGDKKLQQRRPVCGCQNALKGGRKSERFMVVAADGIQKGGELRAGGHGMVSEVFAHCQNR